MAKDKTKPANQIPARAAVKGRPEMAPRVQEPIDFMGSKPLWSFASVDLAGPFGWKLLSPEVAEELLARLRALEAMTWHEIAMIAKKRNHSIAVGACSAAAQERLQEIGLDDVDELFSLGVNAKSRVFGILDRNAFKFLWWDPDHQVCPSRLKHT